MKVAALRDGAAAWGETKVTSAECERGLEGRRFGKAGGRNVSRLRDASLLSGAVKTERPSDFPLVKIRLTLLFLSDALSHLLC